MMLLARKVCVLEQITSDIQYYENSTQSKNYII